MSLFASQDLRTAAAGLEYWLKYNKCPDIQSLKSRFTDWSFNSHGPPINQTQKDSWSCGLFVMMAMKGLSDLDFSYIRRDGLSAVKTSALQAIHDMK
jgi:hypothetical protein